MPRLAVGELLLGLGVALLGLFVLIETQAIPVSPAYARVGPRVFPTLVGAVTLAVGLALALQVWRARGRPPGPRAEPAQPPVAWRGPALITAGLLLQGLLFEPAGFVLASTLLVVLVGAGFGSRRWIRDLAVGLVLSVVAFEGFTRGLALSLPAGVLEGIL